MKPATCFLSIVLPALATASFFGGGQKVLDEALAVPGENPLEFCEEANDYTLEIEKVDLSPNPPKPYVTSSKQTLPSAE